MTTFSIWTFYNANKGGLLEYVVSCTFKKNLFQSRIGSEGCWEMLEWNFLKHKENICVIISGREIWIIYHEHNMAKTMWTANMSAECDSDIRALMRSRNWWKVTKYFYSSAVLKYKFEVLYLSILCYFIPLLHYNLKANIVHFTLLHLFNSLSY